MSTMRIVAMVVCLTCFTGRSLTLGDASAVSPELSGGLLVLDNSDPDFKGKDVYNDQLSCIDASGKLVFRVGGFNNCETIGSNHKVALDAKRGWVWVAENVGNRVLKYDLAGEQLLELPDKRATALAVDPKSGNLWVATSKGTIYGDATLVIDPHGKTLHSFDVRGFDIAYDSADEAFWLAGPNLTKIDTNGKVIFNKQSIAAWCSSSLAIDQTNGTAWVVVRKHPDVSRSRNELLAFDSNGKLLCFIPLGDNDHPFHVSIDRLDGSVWVSLLRQGVERYTAKGGLVSKYAFPVLAAEADDKGGLWVITPEKILKLNESGKVVRRSEHKGMTSQVWTAGI